MTGENIDGLTPIPWWRQTIRYLGVCLVEAALSAVLIVVFYLVLVPLFTGESMRNGHLCAVCGLVVFGPAIWALSVVRSHPGIGVNALAKAMDIHQTTASNLVKALVNGEMLVAEKNGPDRRAVQLRVLAAGAKVLRRAPGPFAGVLPDALARLDAETLDRLDQDLSKLIRELGVDDKAAGIPLSQM